jgi:hypothetical protein
MKLGDGHKLTHLVSRRELAREILKQALGQFLVDCETHGTGCKVFQDPEDGEFCIEYEGRSRRGYGHVQYFYKPLDAVTKIIEECERILDSHTMTITFKNIRAIRQVRSTEKLSADQKTNLVREMAWFGTMALLSSFVPHTGLALQEGFENSLLLAEAGLDSILALCLKAEGGKGGADCRDEIDGIAAKATRRRKKELNSLLRSLPGLLTTRENSGRPLDPNFDERRHQAEQHLKSKGIPATQERMAEALGISTRAYQGNLKRRRT